MTGRSASHGPRPARALLTAAALAALSLGIAGPASASGPVLVTEGDLDLTAQRTVISWNGGFQRMLLDYDVEGQVEEGAKALILLAVPSAPQVSVADPAVMEAFIAAGSPELIEEEVWWPDLDSFSGGDGAAAWERAETPLAPVGEVPAQHGAIGADQLIGWYTSQGYQINEEAEAAIRSYAEAGWTFLDVSFDPGAGATEGTIPVLDLTFASAEPVVPMLLTSTGARPVALSTYMLGAERLDRTSMPSSASVRFSGDLTAASDPELAGWISLYGESAVMTVVDQAIPVTSQVTDDIRFGPSIYGPVSAGSQVKRVERIILGVPAGLVLVAGGMLVVAIGGVTASRLMQRGYRD